MRKYFTLVLILLALSCGKDTILDNETNNFAEAQILEFASLDKMSEKIIEITELIKEKESNILKNILLRNEISQNESGYIAKNTAIVKDITYNDIKADLEFYHRERLNSIYELRKELGFTSLQSIADEINSLKLLEPNKADELYFKNKGLLEKSKFEVFPIFKDEISNVLNAEGKVKVDGNILDLDIINEEYYNSDNKDTDMAKVAEIDEVAGGTGYTGETSNYIANDSGILGSKFGVFMVVWKAGRMRDTKNWLYRYAYYTKFAGFANIGNNVYVSYPITINAGAPSYCKFEAPRVVGYIKSYFYETGTTDGSDFNYYSSSRSFYLNKIVIQQSTFSVFLNGVTHSISTNYFSRDYDNYDPNEPPIFD